MNSFQMTTKVNGIVTSTVTLKIKNSQFGLCCRWGHSCFTNTPVLSFKCCKKVFGRIESNSGLLCCKVIIIYLGNFHPMKTLPDCWWYSWAQYNAFGPLVCFWTDFTNIAVMVTDKLRNLTLKNRSTHCTLVSDRGPLGLLLLIVFISLQQRWRGYCNWESEWVGARVDYSFEIANHFQTSHVSCGWWEEESYWFSRRGSVINLIGRWHSENYYTITQYLSFFYFLNKAHYRCSRQVWRRSYWKKWHILPRSGPAPWRIWPKNNNTWRGPRVLHPYKVSSKSIKRFWRRTDGRLWTDGLRTMTIGHLRLRLRWAKKQLAESNKQIAISTKLLVKS